MQREWQRIDTWLQANAPHIYITLNEGASAMQLNALEDKLGVVLPNDMRESYMIHDGQSNDNDDEIIPCLLDGMFYMLTIDEITEYWQTLQEVMATADFPNESEEDSPEVQSYWWHEKWIPIFSNDAGDLWCIDLAPSDYGTKGQIIEFWHDDVGRTLVARNLRTLLRNFANDLENGIYEVDETGLYPPDDDEGDV